jgi:hypothetical protein
MDKAIGGCFIIATMATLIGCDRPPNVPLPPPAVPSQLKIMTEQELHDRLMPAPASCNIESLDSESLNGQPVHLGRQDVMLSGWVLPEASHKPIPSATVRFVGYSGNIGWEVNINSWLPRNDVLTAMKATKSGNVGFTYYLATSVIGDGKYHLSIVFSDGGIEYSCDKGTVVISP